MCKPVEIFWISTRGFPGPRNNSKWVLSRLCFWQGTAQMAQFRAMRIISGTSRHATDAPFVGEFWWGTYGLDAVSQFFTRCHLWCYSWGGDRSMAPYVKALSSSCFYHIRSFRQIRPSLDDSMAASVASAFISSRLDQLNSIPYGTRLKQTARLQRIQHAVARVVLYQHSRTSLLSSSELLKQLHWLPIEWHIRFKLATMTFKALHTDCPPYLSEFWPPATSWT